MKYSSKCTNIIHNHKSVSHKPPPIHYFQKPKIFLPNESNSRGVHAGTRSGNDNYMCETAASNVDWYLDINFLKSLNGKQVMCWTWIQNYPFVYDSHNENFDATTHRSHRSTETSEKGWAGFISFHLPRRARETEQLRFAVTLINL